MADRRVLVVGGGVIGVCCAYFLAKEGADVVLAARTPEKLAAVEEEITALGRRALSVPTDIADEEQCRALAERALAEFGYEVTTDGAFGAATERVVAAFQRHFRPRQIDGVVDPETAQRIFQVLARA